MKGCSGVCVCFWFISHNFLFDNTAERSHLDTIREEIPIIIAEEKEMYNNGTRAVIGYPDGLGV